jgi:hypothetical protein
MFLIEKLPKEVENIIEYRSMLYICIYTRLIKLLYRVSQKELRI